MFDVEIEKQKYFSVNYSTYVGDVHCIPQVCYKLNRDIKKTVENMVEKNLAIIYDEEVRFVSGKPVALVKKEKVSAPEVIPVLTSKRTVRAKKGKEFD